MCFSLQHFFTAFKHNLLIRVGHVVDIHHMHPLWSCSSDRWAYALKEFWEVGTDLIFRWHSKREFRITNRISMFFTAYQILDIAWKTNDHTPYTYPYADTTTCERFSTAKSELQSEVQPSQALSPTYMMSIVAGCPYWVNERCCNPGFL